MPRKQIIAYVKHKREVMEHLNRNELFELTQFYTTKIDAKRFLQLLPNPENYFNNLNNPLRKIEISRTGDEYILLFLKNHFNYIYIKRIVDTYYSNYCNVILTVNKLEKCPKDLKVNRREQFVVTQTDNIELLKYIVYVKYKKEIIEYIRENMPGEKLGVAEPNEHSSQADENNNNNNSVGELSMITDNCDECKEQYKTVLELLPDADPEYLESKCFKYSHDRYGMEKFVLKCFSKRHYPTRREYERNKDISEKTLFYTTNFNVEKFLDVIPDPETYFNDPNRNTLTYAGKIIYNDYDYGLEFLKNECNHIFLEIIINTFVASNYNVVRTVNQLEKCHKDMKVKRKRIRFEAETENIYLLQQIAYVKHKEEITAYLQQRQKNRDDKIEDAKQSGLLVTCQCCYDEDVLFDETLSCEIGHIFCTPCVQKACEVGMGEGKLYFNCLQNCQQQFSLYNLQAVLSPNIYSKIAQKKQLEEVKAAGLTDIEYCPFCEFAFIPAATDKVFRCMNDQCLKETCRLCKEPSHIPLRCDEVEKDDEVKIRTHLENRMTDALVRTCYKCNMKYIKEDGCNKMTCSCGALMCYVCKQPVKDYTHFNGQGGTRFELCPLFSNTVKLHARAVYDEARKVKEELGIDGNEKHLKYDPTKDLIQHYTQENRSVPMQ